MKRCDRIESEGWRVADPGERSSRDEEIAAHSSRCADCREGWAKYQRIARALGDLGAELEPRADSEARLWAAIARDNGRQRRWIVWLGLPAALAAAAALFLFLLSSDSGPDSLSKRALAVAVLPPDGSASADPIRSGDPAIGNRLQATVGIGEFAHGSLRIYRNDRELLVACPGAPECVIDADVVGATVTIDAIGVYQVVWLTSQNPIPPPSSSLGNDLENAMSQGADYQLRELEVK